MGFAPELLKTAAGLSKTISIKKGSEVVNPGRVSTGSLTLDVALGGGWPMGQWSEVYGEASNGKTALCLKTIAHNQKLDPDFTTVWVAAETWFPEWAEKLGIDNDRVIVIEGTIMEDIYDAVLKILDTKQVDLLVIDSLPALVSMAEDEKSMEEFAPGRNAFQTNKFFRKVTKHLLREPGERQCACIMINQFRMKMGVMHGDPRTTPGGQGKDYAMAVRLEVRRTEWIETGKGKSKGSGTGRRRIGLRLRARTTKNKTFPPQQVADLDFYVSDGGPVPAGCYDTVKEIATLAVVYGVVRKKTSWYYFTEIDELNGGREVERKWQGEDAMLESLSEEPLLAAQMDREVRELMVNGVMDDEDEE